MKRVFVAIIFLALAGCTDSTKAALSSYGKEGHIICYSGGKVIFEGHSTGKLCTVSQSDGWEFMSKETGKFIRVSGDCVIEN